MKIKSTVLIIHFYKYQGAGNDFVMVDDRDKSFPAGNFSLVNKLCDRRFGIGADGLILLQPHSRYDFEMKYFNSDGKPATMCGNGGRCIVRFARDLSLVGDKTIFWAADGIHEAFFKKEKIHLGMKPVDQVNVIGLDMYLLDTGSPHLVIFRDSISGFDVLAEGRKYRYDKNISEAGVNVNFAKMESPESIALRTYERGVEDETFACGTGSVATAIAACIRSNCKTGNHSTTIHVRGGELVVSFNRMSNRHFDEIFLAGPAERVFEGNLTIG